MEKGITQKEKNLFGDMVDHVIPQQVRDLVEKVLRDFPQTRNDDMLLYSKVWELQGIRMDFDQFRKQAMKAETIGRHKRQLQERGHYRANTEVEKAKHEKAEQFRTYYGND